ncbi:hypothetical protein NDK25_27885 [Niallia taxi]|nr:hypothetical protein [Niallia taxi]MDE5056016.1 hypothetical protein [Niallia taxi]
MTKQKKTTEELLAELRATGYNPYVDKVNDAKVVTTAENGAVREVGTLNTMRLAKYLIRQ